MISSTPRGNFAGDGVTENGEDTTVHNAGELRVIQVHFYLVRTGVANQNTDQSSQVWKAISTALLSKYCSDGAEGTLYNQYYSSL